MQTTHAAKPEKGLGPGKTQLYCKGQRDLGVLDGVFHRELVKSILGGVDVGVRVGEPGLGRHSRRVTEASPAGMVAILKG